MTLRDAVICEPVRTPVGRYGGVLRELPAHRLAADLVRELVERHQIPSGRIGDVILGQCYPNSEAPAIGRVAALDAGLPVTVPGMQIDRRCGSGLMAVLIGAMQVQTGAVELVLAGGAESMSSAEFSTAFSRWRPTAGQLVLHDRLERGRVTAGGALHPVPGGMLETAENLRREFSITRDEQDALALESHRRAVAAQDEGRFDDEIVPVVLANGERVDRDEHPRRDSSLEQLSRLRPVMGRTDPDATVTAGNASGQNDGASLCFVAHRGEAEALHLRPLARLVSWAVAGVPPQTMGIGPVPASELALQRAGLTMADMDLIELNEAFAAQVLACTKAWQFGAADLERVNVNGSGISLGHPVGATGGRILATMLRELDRRDGRYCLETMCIGGGQGLAAIFEVLPS
jgi:acetyl-CoA C-acetyltransferase